MHACTAWMLCTQTLQSLIENNNNKRIELIMQTAFSFTDTVLYCTVVMRKYVNCPFKVLHRNVRPIRTGQQHIPTWYTAPQKIRGQSSPMVWHDWWSERGLLSGLTWLSWSNRLVFLCLLSFSCCSIPGLFPLYYSGWGLSNKTVPRWRLTCNTVYRLVT